MTESESPDVILVTTPITVDQLKQIAAGNFGDMVKAVVDVELRIMALGGGLHSDEEALLLQRGSEQLHLWGINIYPDRTRLEWIEFDSLINVRPRQNNRSRGVEDAVRRQLITDIVNTLIL